MSPSLSELRGLAAGDLHDRRVGEDPAHVAILALGDLLPPPRQLERHGSRLSLEVGHPGQPPKDLVGVALVARLLQRAGLLPRPLQAPALLEPLAQRSGQRQQVLHVRAGVGKLLVGQRPPVPARERRRLRHGRAQELPEQRLVARLHAGSHERRGDLGVEQVPRLQAPDALHERDVLPPRVHARPRRPDRRAPARPAPGPRRPAHRRPRSRARRRPRQRAAPGTAAPGSGPRRRTRCRARCAPASARARRAPPSAAPPAALTRPPRTGSRTRRGR